MKKSKKGRKGDIAPRYYGHALITEGKWAGRTVYVDDYPTDKSAFVYFIPANIDQLLMRNRSHAVQIRISSFAPMSDIEWRLYEYEYGA